MQGVCMYICMYTRMHPGLHMCKYYICIHTYIWAGVYKSGSLMINISVYSGAFASRWVVGGRVVSGGVCMRAIRTSIRSCAGACYVAVGAI